MQLRLVHQLSMMEQDKSPNNHINPADLTDIEKQPLKESFAVVRRLQNVLSQEFRLND